MLSSRLAAAVVAPFPALLIARPTRTLAVVDELAVVVSPTTVLYYSKCAGTDV